jgi:hypothetical protein
MSRSDERRAEVDLKVVAQLWSNAKVHALSEERLREAPGLRYLAPTRLPR